MGETCNVCLRPKTAVSRISSPHKCRRESLTGDYHEVECYKLAYERLSSLPDNSKWAHKLLLALYDQHDAILPPRSTHIDPSAELVGLVAAIMDERIKLKARIAELEHKLCGQFYSCNCAKPDGTGVCKVDGTPQHTESRIKWLEREISNAGDCHDMERVRELEAELDAFELAAELSRPPHGRCATCGVCGVVATQDGGTKLCPDCGGE